MEEDKGRMLRTVYVQIPTRVFEQMQKNGMLKTLDAWITSIIIEEIERRKGMEEHQGERRE